jgi:hypothetical protein
MKGEWQQQKRVYRLIEKGEATMRAILNANNQIRHLTATSLKVQKQISELRGVGTEEFRSKHVYCCLHFFPFL